MTEIPEERFDLKILQSFRRIMRAIDIYSRKLSSEYKLTSPQLICLIALKDANEPLMVSQISSQIFLSPGTVVGILDRLEKKNYICRQRDTIDRRKVYITLTEEGEDMVKNTPSPLQDNLMDALQKLPRLEQVTIALSLEKIVELMEVKKIDASPILETGPIDSKD